MHKASDISYRLILEVTISEITSEALNSSLSHISWHLTDIYIFCLFVFWSTSTICCAMNAINLFPVVIQWFTNLQQLIQVKLGQHAVSE